MQPHSCSKYFVSILSFAVLLCERYAQNGAVERVLAKRISSCVLIHGHDKAPKFHGMFDHLLLDQVKEVISASGYMLSGYIPM